MRVLKKGRKQKGWAKEFICMGEGNGDGGCGATLLVERADLYQTASSCMGEVEYHVSFVCVNCGVMTDIDHEYPGSWEALKKWKPPTA
jgi:hypothetical protein